jgi:hypothetical protein
MSLRTKYPKAAVPWLLRVEPVLELPMALSSTMSIMIGLSWTGHFFPEPEGQTRYFTSEGQEAQDSKP